MEFESSSENLTLSNIGWGIIEVEPVKKAKILNDEMAHICYIVIKSFLYDLFAGFGIVTNIFNLYIFTKLGFKDTVNVTLFGLTLSDLGSLLILFWMGICHNPLFTYSDVHFDTLSVTYLSGGWPKLYFTRVTSWITAFVALERCLCIALPLKVKTLLTPRRACYSVIAIFLVIGSTMPPVYMTTGLDWKWYPKRNKTLLGLVFTEGKQGVYNVVVAINLFFTVGSFFFVIACTLILVINLKLKTKWRESVAGPPGKQAAASSSRDKRVSTMVVFLSILFVVCLFPGTVLFLVMIFEPDFNKGEAYHNLFTTVWGVCHLFEAANSSLNIFVYVKMSSKYKQVFITKFWCLRSCVMDEAEETKKFSSHQDSTRISSVSNND
ncbi:uncharacterized protein LOC101862551 [Aplysia californica]|uniref:Uncharacterized protein LOC101862551 n=1 Tax=Aplysia californica TaxID=6500 RepID=A0ABM0JDA0_APLCA|nr:uncharacterized protein LOC101862551 [Aplysia californica]